MSSHPRFITIELTVEHKAKGELSSNNAQIIDLKEALEREYCMCFMKIDVSLNFWVKHTVIYISKLKHFLKDFVH